MSELNTPRARDGRPLRVIFVTITFDPEPGALRGLPLAKWLAARGFDVRVLTAFPQYPTGRIYPGYRMRPWMREVMDGIPVLRVPIYPSHDTNPVRRVWTYLSFMLSAALIGVPLVGRADVVFLYEPPPTNGLASLLLKWIWGAPVIHHIADMWPETVLSSGMLPRPIHRLAEAVIGGWCRFLYRRAAFMSVLSEGFGRMLVERGVEARRVMVSYNWTDEDTFRPLPRDGALAKQLGLEGHFNVVYAGNIGPMQGLETAVRAAALLRDRAPALRLVIIGTGPREAAVKALATKLGASNVRFLPRREYWEMPAINALSDVMLVHLRDFGFLAATIPSKTQVALASGRPVLMAVRGDAAELVQRSGGGLCCPPDDPEAMAESLLAFSRMAPVEREAMGNRGLAWYRQHLALDIAGSQMAEALVRAYAGRADAPSAGARPALACPIPFVEIA